MSLLVLQPNLSGAWLFQRAMSARVGSNPNPNFINDLLSTNFGAMQASRCLSHLQEAAMAA